MFRHLAFPTLSIFALTLLMTACVPRSEPAGTLIAPDTRQISHYVDEGGKTGILGRVVLKETGGAVEEAYVNIYPSAFSNLMGPSQFISPPTAADGSYSMEIPPGTYYIVARKRTSGQPMGPLSPGDYYSEHQRIVTEVVEGRMAVVDVPVVSMKAPMFFRKTMGEKEGHTGVRGRLVDENGKGVPGAFATAYSNEDVRRVPDYVSNLTGADGEFTLYLPEGGTYYLAARMHAWDMPQPGEPYGRHGGDDPAPVRVAEGSFVENLNIVMEPFTGEYTPGKSRRPF